MKLKISFSDVRSLISMFMLVLFTVLVSSCGKSASSKGSGKIELTVWESLGGPDEFIRRAGKSYTRLHPNVEINFVNVEISETMDRLQSEALKGMGPDLFASPHDRLGQLLDMYLIMPTADPVGSARGLVSLCSSAMDYNGRVYGYPVSTETYALFYNKKLISESELPATWEKLGEWVKEFNALNPEKQGFVMNVGEGYYTIIFTTYRGNYLFGLDGVDVKHSYMNTANAVKGMNVFQSLRDCVGLPADELTTDKNDERFKNGTAAMYITGLWNVRAFEEAGIDFGVAPLPALLDENHPACSFGATRAMYVSANAKHPEEASEFARYLLTPEMQQLRYNLTGAMPSIETDIADKYMPGFLKQLENSFLTPAVPEMQKFWTAMAEASVKIWDGADVEQEMNACDAAITK